MTPFKPMNQIEKTAQVPLLELTIGSIYKPRQHRYKPLHDRKTACQRCRYQQQLLLLLLRASSYPRIVRWFVFFGRPQTHSAGRRAVGRRDFRRRGKRRRKQRNDPSWPSFDRKRPPVGQSSGGEGAAAPPFTLRRLSSCLIPHGRIFLLPARPR